MANDRADRIRCDPTGRAFAGRQRQIQTYVNQHADNLQQEISIAFGTPFSLRWASPLRSEKYEEYCDERFLSALGLLQHRGNLDDFWPKRGPVWDALASDTFTGGVMLLEAKSHLPEVRGSGCKAAALSSIQKIDASIAQTKRWLSVPAEFDWKGDLYQSANRLAHLHFFRNILQSPAWLVNVYFIDDPHCPTSRAEWNSGLNEVKRELGIGTVPFCADIFLPALPGVD